MVRTEYLTDKRWNVTHEECDRTRNNTVVGFSHYGAEPYITLDIRAGGTLQFTLEEAEIIRDGIDEILGAIAKEAEGVSE